MPRPGAALAFLVILASLSQLWVFAEVPGVCTLGPGDVDAGTGSSMPQAAAPTCIEEQQHAHQTATLLDEKYMDVSATEGAEEVVDQGDTDVDQMRTELRDLLTQAKATAAALEAATRRFEQLLDSRGLGHSGQPQQAAAPAHAEQLRSTSTGKAQQPLAQSRATITNDPFMAAADEVKPGSLAKYDGWQRLVARGRRSWLEFFSLVAAVKADSNVTAMHSMYENSYYGTFRYLVLGDEQGKLYFLGPQAQVLMEYSTGTTSPVTAITSYAVDHTTTLVATGHQDGELRHHLLRDTLAQDTGDGTINNVTLHATVPHPYANKDAPGEEEEAPSIIMLDVHQHQMSSTTVVVDRRGSHRMVNPDGTVRFTTYSGAKVLNARKGRTVTAMAVSDGIWVGVAPPYEHVMRKLPCANLNGTSFVAAAFDVVRPYLLYAVTTDGQLLTLLAPTDNRVDNCTIWAQRPLALPPGRIQLLSIKSYLLLAHELGVAVFNVTAAQPLPPVDVLIEPFSNIAGTFGSSVHRVAQPLIGGSQAHMLAVHFGGGVVGLFTHSLPIYRPPHMNLHLWSKPIFIVVMILVGVWQFNRNSRNSPHREPLFGGGGADMDPAAMFGGGSMLRDRGGDRLDPAAIEALVRRVRAEDNKMRSRAAYA